ncbi:hypothetical protein DSECCO2_474960 [anaerobic digester metagenome]
MRLDSIVIEPTARSPPYFCSDELKAMLSRLSVLCIMKGDTPSSNTGIMMDLFIFKLHFLILRLDFGPVRNFITQSDDSAWERTVANAAPFTPMLNPNMNMGSSTMFVTAPIITVSMLYFA